MILIKNVIIERTFDPDSDLAAHFVDYEVETSTGRILIWISKIYLTPGLPQSFTRRVVNIVSDKYGHLSKRVRRGDIKWIKQYDADSAYEWLTKTKET